MRHAIAPVLLLLGVTLLAGVASAGPVDDAWNAYVKPRLDCWYFGGGPGYQWLWSDVMPYPSRPLPTGRLPPCV